MTESVPPGGEPLRKPPATWWRWRYLVPVLAFACAGIGASTVRIPYYAIAPGAALDVSQLVEVIDAESFEPEGQINLTTVRLRHVTVIEAVTGWLDPTIDVVEEEVVLPPEVPSSELNDFNLQLMDVSKQTALGVALEALGVDAISGSGAAVAGILEGAPADGVLAPGDVIVGVDGTEIALHYEAVSAVGEHRPGDRVAVTYLPGGEEPERTVEVTLASQDDLERPAGNADDAPASSRPSVPPDTEGRPFLGVTLQTRDLAFDFPIEVEIESERIGGPSAGLAFTLEVLDVLTEGELTGGRRIAATGTIELDGSVGPVGGVPQKAVAVERAGIELFLVPRESYREARAMAGDGLRVEPVDDLDDALAVLESMGGSGIGRATDDLRSA